MWFAPDEDLAKIRKKKPLSITPIVTEEIIAPPHPSVRSIPPPVEDAEEAHGADYEDRTLPSSKVPPMMENRIVHDEDEGSEFRYIERLSAFSADSFSFSWARHYAYWVLHNVLAHTFLGVFPGQKTVDFHDLTSGWLNKQPPQVGGLTPNITNKWMWFVHNVVAHPAIGFLPCRLTFAFHDWTARKMGIPGWV